MMIRAPFIASVLAASICSGCATPDSAQADKYAELEKQTRGKSYTLKLTGSRLRVEVEEGETSPATLSPMNVIYGGDVHAQPWVDSTGR